MNAQTEKCDVGCSYFHIACFIRTCSPYAGDFHGLRSAPDKPKNTTVVHDSETRTRTVACVPHNFKEENS